jgi:hypothetical protein
VTGGVESDSKDRPDTMTIFSITRRSLARMSAPEKNFLVGGGRESAPGANP